MKKLHVLFIFFLVLLFGINIANACTKEGYIYCDVNQNGVIDSEDTPMAGVRIMIDSSWDYTTDATGYFYFELPGNIGHTYVETLDESTLPSDFIYVIPASGVATFTVAEWGEHFYNDWLIDSSICREGKCWFTGGGAKFEPIVNDSLAVHGPKDSFGGNVYPGCNPDSGDGGQWNHIAHKLKLHFQGWTIHVEECGNVPGIEPGSESPVTPYNYIDFSGIGTLKGISGNKVDYGTVFFFAHCEDRNEPGSSGAKDGALIDRYFLHVFDSTGATLLLIDMDGDPTTVDPVTITDGNFQLHISSCDN